MAAEQEALLLLRARARSYGSIIIPGSSTSTSSFSASLSPLHAATFLTHIVQPDDSLQRLALKYGVTIEQIKMCNKLYTNDSIFIRRTLRIPDSRFPSDADSHEEHAEESPSRTDPSSRTESKSEASDLTSQDFLFRLDSRIRKSKLAAKKMQRDTERPDRIGDSDNSDTTYHGT